MLPNSVSYCRAEPSSVLAAAPRPRKKAQKGLVRGCDLRSAPREIGPLARRGIPGTHVEDSDCVGGVLARSCSGADLRQPGIPRRARADLRSQP